MTTTSAGSISTGGSNSRGILAQSIGGGGGNGGGDLLGIVTIGGSGGSAGSGGTVSVTIAGAINTTGANSEGILAQSIGGGGGNADATSGALAIGGAGGSSGSGSDVTVSNSAAIQTGGASSHGIAAQSIGGGGGSGAAANGILTFGGSGASSGNGGHVTVTNNAGSSIITSGEMAYGIFAQSIGGGGGGGGNVVSGSVLISASVGGTGGAAGSGGDVDVTNAGSITTHGGAGVGIFAQSVGGGGGNAGFSGNYTAFNLSPVGVGGSGGASGDGGNINVTNASTGTISTSGAGATAIFAQSIGGGGGNGGGAMTITGSLGIAFSVGGSGASGGRGGNINVTNAGAITTSGINSVAIFAQSVGGGGGSAGSSLAVTIGPVVPIGGSSGANGRGGDVTIVNNGSIHMTGAGSVGLFAQSVGGGGGIATVNGASTFALNAGGNGNGGTVTVTNHGTIMISGDNSAGVFIQSVGGGGGVIGKSGDLLGLDPMFQGTAGGVGTGAAVSLVQDHDVASIGLNSFGILAQSAGGTGNGNIGVTVTSGTTITGGTGTGAGVGFLGGATNLLTNNGTITSLNQALGFAVITTTGDDTIDNFGILTGSVDLGAGTNAINNQAGATFNMGASVMLGAGNNLTNDGIMSPGGAGYVLASTVTGNLTQTATGNYLLDVDLKPKTADSISVNGTALLSGVVTPNFLNKSQAQPGSQQFTIFSATGGTTNSGLTLNAPKRAVISYSLLYPNANDIVLAYTIDFSQPNLPRQYQSIGSTINAIQTARTSPGFAPIADALFDLPDLNALMAFYDAVGGGGTAATQQTAIGAGVMFNSLLVDQTNSWLTGAYGNGSVIVDDGPLGFAAKEKSRAASHPAFQDIRAQAPASFSDRWRMWFAPFGTHRLDSADSTTGSPSATMASVGAGFGIERQLGNDTMFGFAVGGSDSSFSVPGRSTSGTLYGGHFGAYGAMRLGAFYLSGSAGYGRFDNSTSRFISAMGLPLEQATGRFSSDQAFGRLEIGRRQGFGSFWVTPFAAVQFVQLWQPGYSETSVVAGGAPGVLGLNFQSVRTLSLPASVGMQFDARFAMPSGQVWTPYVRAAWVHEFNPDRSVTAAFNVAPGFLFNTIGTPAAADAAQVTAGGNLALSRNVSLFGNFTGEFAKKTQSYSGLGGLRVNW